jgi:hypothetical protein
MAQTLNQSELQSASSPAPIALASRGEHYITRLLEELGEDPQREGLERTPYRVWESLNFLTDLIDHPAVEEAQSLPCAGIVTPTGCMLVRRYHQISFRGTRALPHSPV